MTEKSGTQLRAVSRRTFLRNAALASALLPGAGAMLASCGGGGGEAGDGELAVPRVLLTSPTQPSYVETVYGPVEYGKDFGLPMTIDDFKEFDSHATAMQALLSGRGDIIGGSMISHLIIQSRGEDIKVFCPFVNLDDFVLAGSSGVTEIKQLTDPSTLVAVDSPGGAGEGILNAMLDQAGLEATVDDLPNAKILESSDLRTSAWASGDVDATIIHLVQYQDAAKEVSDP